MSDYCIPGGVRIGHVHLSVADLERSERFYCGLLGFPVVQRWREEALFIAAGDYHHHLGLNIWAGRGAPPPPPGHSGLYHFAILYPTRAALGRALARLLAAGHPIDGAADHGVSEAVYLRDPDGNGVEIYRDRPRSEWPRDAAGELAMITRRLDLDALLAAAAYTGDALHPQEVAAELEHLPHFRGDESELRAELDFPGFGQALAFCDLIGQLAEEHRHHPDIELSYRTVRLRLMSHDRQGVSHRDVRLARAIEELLAERP